MAFNYGYNPYGNQPSYQAFNQGFNQGFNQTNTQQNGDGRIWVQGEVGAKAYLVAPGNTVALWDSEQQVIWLKTVMPNGVPSMSKLIYSMDDPTPAPVVANNPDYITRAEFERRIAELNKAEVKRDDE